MAMVTTPIQQCTGNYSQCNQAGKRNKRNSVCLFFYHYLAVSMTVAL